MRGSREDRHNSFIDSSSFIISSRETIMDSVTKLRKHLTLECTRKGNPPAEEGMNSDTEEDTVLETRFVENFDLSQFPN